MLECFWIIICGIFPATALHYDLSFSKAENKHRSVNLALETVLEFNKKDNVDDIKFLDNVHNFIDKIKTVINKKNIRHRDFKNAKLENFTDFLLVLISILNKYEDKDLENLFVIISEEMRKYHYKGCKFHELTENINLRKYVARKLDEFKNLPGVDIKKKLATIANKIEQAKYEKEEKELVDFINSLYSKEAIEKFKTILIEFDDCRLKTRRNFDVTGVVKNGVRKLFFDFYTDLNVNARAALRSKLNDFWTYVMDAKSLLDTNLYGIFQKRVYNKNMLNPKRFNHNIDNIYEDIVATTATERVVNALRERQIRKYDDLDWEYDPNPRKEWADKVHKRKVSIMTLYPAYVANWKTPSPEDIKPKKTKLRKGKLTTKDDEIRTLRQMYVEKHLDLKYDPYAYDNLTTVNKPKLRRKTRTTRFTTTYSKKHLRQKIKSKHLKVETMRPHTTGEVKRFSKFIKYKFDSNKPIGSHEDIKHLKKYEIHLQDHKPNSKKPHHKKAIVPLDKPKVGLPIGLLINDILTPSEHIKYQKHRIKMSKERTPKLKRLRTVPTLPSRKTTRDSLESEDLTEEIISLYNSKHTTNIPTTTKSFTRSDEDSLQNHIPIGVKHKEPIFDVDVPKNIRYSTTTPKNRTPFVGREPSNDHVFDNNNSIDSYELEIPTRKTTKKVFVKPTYSAKYTKSSIEDEEKISKEQLSELKSSTSRTPKIIPHKLVLTSTTNKDDEMQKKIFDEYLYNKGLREAKTKPTYKYKIKTVATTDDLITSKEHIDSNRLQKERYTTSKFKKIMPVKLVSSVTATHQIPLKEYFEDLGRGDEIIAKLTTSRPNPSFKQIQHDSNEKRSPKEEAALFDDNMSIGALGDLGDASTNQIKILSAIPLDNMTDVIAENTFKNVHFKANVLKKNRRNNAYHTSLDNKILKRIQKLENELKVVKTQIKDDNEIIEDLKTIVREKESKFIRSNDNDDVIENTTSKEDTVDKNFKQLDVVNNEELVDFERQHTQDVSPDFVDSKDRVDQYESELLLHQNSPDINADDNNDPWDVSINDDTENKFIYRARTEKYDKQSNMKNKPEQVNLRFDETANTGDNPLTYDEYKGMAGKKKSSKLDIIRLNEENILDPDKYVNDHTVIYSNDAKKVESENRNHSPSKMNGEKINNDTDSNDKKRSYNLEYTNKDQEIKYKHDSHDLKEQNSTVVNSFKTNTKGYGTSPKEEKLILMKEQLGLKSNKELNPDSETRISLNKNVNTAKKNMLQATDLEGAVSKNAKENKEASDKLVIAEKTDSPDLKINQENNVDEFNISTDLLKPNDVKKNVFDSKFNELKSLKAPNYYKVLNDDNKVVFKANDETIHYDDESIRQEVHRTFDNKYYLKKNNSHDMLDIKEMAPFYERRPETENKPPKGLNTRTSILTVSNQDKNIHVGRDVKITHNSNNEHKSKQMNLSYSNINHQKYKESNENGNTTFNINKQNIEKQITEKISSTTNHTYKAQTATLKNIITTKLTKDTINKTLIKSTTKINNINRQTQGNVNILNKTTQNNTNKSAIQTTPSRSKEEEILEKQEKINKIEEILLEDNWKEINPSAMFSEIDKFTATTVPIVDRKLLLPLNYKRRTTITTVSPTIYNTRGATFFPEIPANIDRIKIDESPVYVNTLNLLKPAQLALQDPIRKSELYKVRDRPRAPKVGEQDLVVENPLAFDNDLKERYRDKIKEYTKTIFDDLKPSLEERRRSEQRKYDADLGAMLRPRM